MVKKADIILIAAILLLGFGLFFLLVPRSTGTTVVVRVNNEEVKRLPLNEDFVLELEGNTLIIKDHKAYMDKANCPDKVCINQGEISKSGESIICLPNGVIVEVE